MAFATVQLSTDGRRNLGILLSVLCLLQFLIGLALLSCGVHFVKNLQWRILVIDNYDPYTLGMTILVVGGLMSFVHLCGAKIFYDSSKEETRHRFEFILFFMVVLFLCLLVVESSLIIACKVHYDYRLETFKEGFLLAVEKYSKNPEIKVHMDRLQLEDECCGADSFKDWLENDWVAREYNPLANGKTTPSENSVYYPWNINLPPPVKQSPPAPVPVPSYGRPNMPLPPRETVESSNSDISHSGHHYSSEVDPGHGPESGYGNSYENNPSYIGNENNNPNPDSSYYQNFEILETTTIDKSKLDGFPRIPRRLKRSLDTRARFSTHLLVVPWSCCSPDANGPCIHDYVTQRYLVHDLQAKHSWNGESLHQKGCAAQLKDGYNAYLQACFVLFCSSLIFQVIMVVCARYLETSVGNVDLYNREDNSAPGYLLTSTCFGDSSHSFKHHHKLKGTKEEDQTTETTESQSDQDDKDNSSKDDNLKSEYERLLKQKKRKRKQKLLNKLSYRNRNRAALTHNRNSNLDQLQLNNDEDGRNWNVTDDQENEERHDSNDTARIDVEEMSYENVDETDNSPVVPRNQSKSKRKGKGKHQKRKQTPGPEITTGENDPNFSEKINLLSENNSSTSTSRKRKRKYKNKHDREGHRKKISKKSWITTPKEIKNYNNVVQQGQGSPGENEDTETEIDIQRKSKTKDKSKSKAKNKKKKKMELKV